MIETYKKSRTWKKASSLVNKVYTLTQFFPKDKDVDLVDRIRRDSAGITFHIQRGVNENRFSNYISCYQLSYDATLHLHQDLMDSRFRGYIGENVYHKIEEEINDILVTISRQIRMLQYMESSHSPQLAYNYTLLRW